jgi:hypothetical protein
MGPHLPFELLVLSRSPIPISTGNSGSIVRSSVCSGSAGWLD